jgi:hypothetical protein
MIKCSICKKTFEKIFKNQKYCSKECSLIAKKIYREKYMYDYNKEYNKVNRNKITKHNKQYYQTHKKNLLKKRKEYIRNYYKINREHLIEYYKEQYNIHKKIRLEYSKKYRKNRRQFDIGFKLRCNLSNRIWRALKINTKTISTITLIGCTIEQLKQHLEKQFKSGMNWKNYGKWHIDHIRPCASFDLSKSSEQRKCFYYTNLQPLWAEDNLKKQDKI